MADRGDTDAVLGKDSFKCPTCGAFAHQTWYKTFERRFEDGNRPFAVEPDAPQAARTDTALTFEERQSPQQKGDGFAAGPQIQAVLVAFGIGDDGPYRLEQSETRRLHGHP